MYLALAIIETHVFLYYPPLGLPKSGWGAYFSVRAWLTHDSCFFAAAWPDPRALSPGTLRCAAPRSACHSSAAAMPDSAWRSPEHALGS